MALKATRSKKNIDKATVIARLTEVLETMSKERLLALLNQLERNPLKWRRQHPRKKCSLSVDYDTADYSNRKFIRDLSISGVFIESDEAFSIGQDILLWFSAPGDPDLAIHIPGKVVRRDAEGIGVKFENLTKHQQKMIHFFRRINASDTP